MVFIESLLDDKWPSRTYQCARKAPIPLLQWSLFSALSMPSAARQKRPRNDDLLDIRGALIDAKGAYFPVKRLDRMARAHAVAAVNLHRGIDHPLGRFRGVELCHRGLACDPRCPHVLGPGGTVDQQRRRIDL